MIIVIGDPYESIDAYSAVAEAHLGRRSEVGLADLQQVLHLGQQLRVDGQAAVHLFSRLGGQALGELKLKHNDCTSEQRSAGICEIRGANCQS